MSDSNSLEIRAMILAATERTLLVPVNDITADCCRDFGIVKFNRVKRDMIARGEIREVTRAVNKKIVRHITAQPKQLAGQIDAMAREAILAVLSAGKNRYQTLVQIAIKTTACAKHTATFALRDLRDERKVFTERGWWALSRDDLNDLDVRQRTVPATELTPIIKGEPVSPMGFIVRECSKTPSKDFDWMTA